MGIRGIDIQVAIQRAADAEKLQQGEISQARAGEAGLREEEAAQRARRQKQSQKSERSDQVVIQSRRDKERRDQEKPEERNEADISGGDAGQETGDPRRKPIIRGNLDIIA